MSSPTIDKDFEMFETIPVLHYSDTPYKFLCSIPVVQLAYLFIMQKSCIRCL